MAPALEDPLDVNGVSVPNRFYRSPLLECAGNGPDAVDTLIEELAPATASGVGLVFQGASIVRGPGGCAAPNMTHLDDPAFVAGLERLTDAIHGHGGRIFVQLGQGGLRSMEIWHDAYRREHPDLEQLAPSRPPTAMRALDAAGFLDLDVRVLDTDEVYRLAEDFAVAAERCVDAGYDGVHLSAANMGIVQQFLSPYYNRRTDAFGGSRARRTRFLELLHDRIRARVGADVPIVTKVPAETAAPGFVRRHITREDAVAIAERCAAVGYDALVPVNVSTFWDASIVRGSYPARAWEESDLQGGYAEAFGGAGRARLVAALNRLQARRFTFEPAWNADLARDVRDRVDVPVLLEGGIRGRDEIDALLGDACDAVGMGRPFYAEPRLGARMLDGDGGPRRSGETDDTTGPVALCASCNNCTVPQVTGAAGRCRTPAVLEERGRLARQGAYDPE